MAATAGVSRVPPRPCWQLRRNTRYLLAYDHDRCMRVLRIFIRALFGFYRRRARRHGASLGRTGAVTFVQRFGSAANLNLHLHVVVLDGVFVEAEDGVLRFQFADPPADDEIASLVRSVRDRVLRHLGKRALLDDNEQDHSDPLTAEAPLLADCYATSIHHRQTVGAHRGAPLVRVGRDPGATWLERHRRAHAHLDGFDLHANVAIAAQHSEGRAALEKLLRYGARPPIAHDRLSELPDGRICLRLKTPWFDGSTHVVYQPTDFIAKLAALVPRPHKNLLVYHGVLAARAAWRERVVGYGRGAVTDAADLTSAKSATSKPDVPRHKRGQWAQLMRRAFGYALLVCPVCSGKMALVACVMERAAVRRILAHLHLPTEPPSVAGARASPARDPLFYEMA